MWWAFPPVVVGTDLGSVFVLTPRARCPKAWLAETPRLLLSKPPPPQTCCEIVGTPSTRPHCLRARRPRVSFPRCPPRQIHEYSDVSEIGAIVDGWIEKWFPNKATPNSRRPGRGGRAESRDRPGRNRADKGVGGGRDRGGRGHGGAEDEEEGGGGGESRRFTGWCRGERPTRAVACERRLCFPLPGLI